MTFPAPLLRRGFAAIAAALLALLAFAASAQSAPTLLVVGDSISAAYGLPANSGWTTLLARRLQEERYPYRVVNASISGDTTAGGRARLPSLLAEHKPAVVVIELGGNDGLRGGDLRSMRSNLETMVGAALHAGARVLLVGMRLPPNYGSGYTRQFETTYRDVAQKFRVPLVPFLFEGFGESNEWFQPDRIHPTANAQPKLLDNVWPSLKPLLDRRRQG